MPEIQIIGIVKLGIYDAVKELIAKGVNINETNDKGESALLAAAARNDLKIVKLLVNYNVIVNVEDVYGLTPIKWAKHYNNVEMIELLERKLNKKDEVNDDEYEDDLDKSSTYSLMRR